MGFNSVFKGLNERGRERTTKIQCVFFPRIIATQNEKYNGKLEV
jgi:hypothetical protein